MLLSSYLARPRGSRSIAAIALLGNHWFSPWFYSFSVFKQDLDPIPYSLQLLLLGGGKIDDQAPRESCTSEHCR